MTFNSYVSTKGICDECVLEAAGRECETACTGYVDQLTGIAVCQSCGD